MRTIAGPAGGWRWGWRRCWRWHRRWGPAPTLSKVLPRTAGRSSGPPAAARTRRRARRRRRAAGRTPSSGAALAVGPDALALGPCLALRLRVVGGGVGGGPAAAVEQDHLRQVPTIDLAAVPAAGRGAAQHLAATDIVGHRLRGFRSEEHTSELQSLMRHSYAVFCLKKKKNKN